MRARSYEGQRGFTLLELLVVLVVVGLVAFGLFRIFTTTNEGYRRGVENIDGQQNVRAAVSWIGRELRGAKGFNRITPDEVTFLTDENVRNQTRTFRLDTGDQDGDGNTNELLLVRSPDDDGTNGVFTDEIAVGIDSLRFVYRDGAGNVTAARPSVREVEIFVFGSGASFGEARAARLHDEKIGMSTRVQCRNLGKSVPTGGDVTPPASPTGLAVTFGCGTATATWTGVADVDVAGYFLHYSDGNSGPPYDGVTAAQGPSPIYVGSATSYTLTGLDLSANYRLAVQAVDAADNLSGYSGSANGVTSDTTPPAAPTNLSGRVVGDDRIQLSWSAPADWDLASYRITWEDSNDPATTRTSTSTGTSIILSGLAQDAVHTFRVAALDACGNVGPNTPDFSITMIPCDEDVTAPDVPDNVAATGGDEFVRLTWDSVPDTDVVGYQVHFRNPSAGVTSTLQVGNVQTYSVYGLENGTSYQFQVAALDGCGHTGGYSGLIDAVPTACADNVAPPVAPTNLVVTDTGTGDALRVSWAAASESDVLGYRVFWGITPGSWDGSVDVGRVLFHTVNGLTAGSTYYVSVAAYDLCGNESPTAAPQSGVPGWGCLCPPSGGIVTPSDYDVVAGTVSWTVNAVACSTATVERVEFRVDGTVSYVDYAAPYEFGDFGSGWTTSFVPDGPHGLVVEIFDDNGCSVADSAQVFVDNAGAGLSCLGVDQGQAATVSGSMLEQMDVRVENLSAVDTYHLNGLVMNWTDPVLFPYAVLLDGATVWLAGTWPDAGPGDTLHLTTTQSIAPADAATLTVRWWEYPTAPSAPLELAAAGIEVSFLGAPTAECGPYVVPFAAACSLGVTIVSVNSTEPYNVVRDVAVGQQYYSDRTYTLTYLPSELEGATLVRTPNNDKNKGDSHALVLDFDTAVKVWIAYDPRGNPPDWIENNYTATGTSVGVTDTGTPTLGLWSRTFDAGSYTFRGNKAVGWGGAVGTSYVIFVTCP